ncbi:MAG TPA: PEP-CTERM sorting domain-containing protein [Tepidisphaeraceae bacterium]|nr:PEP-CTERM sorting domain-containing protein [Tepidisphaeraceae bacterium]
MKRQRRKLFWAAGAVLMISRRGIADQIYWNGGAGSWFTAANWLDTTDGDQQVPTSADDVFIENGGSPQISAGSAAGMNLTVDASSGSLLSGSLTIAMTETIGDTAAAVFTQSGGTNSAVILYLGTTLGSTGTYVLSGTGVLSVDSVEYLDQGGVALFNQNGGSNNTVALVVDGALGTTGTYSLSGGTVTATGYEIVGNGGTGVFNQSGGNNNEQGTLTIGGGTFASGTYLLSGSASFTVSGGPEYIGSYGVGVFNQTGGTHTIANGNTMFLGYSQFGTGSYTLSAGELNASYTEYVGEFGTGSFNQSGGVNTMAEGGLLIGVQAGSTGTYTLSGTASLEDSIGVEYVGFEGTALFNQSGGTNTPYELYVSELSGSDTYLLSAGNLTTIEYEIIGTQSGGTGTFIQTGGSNTLLAHDNAIYIGDLAGALGIYQLSNGNVTVGQELIVGNSGTGIFVQTGGTTSLTSGSTAALIIGNSSTADGSYTLSGGIVSAVAIDYYGNSEYVGDNGIGIFNQTGGTHTLAGPLQIGYAAGSTGTYSLSGTGSLVAAGNEIVGNSGIGIFNQSGGTNTIENINSLGLAANAGATGTYIQSGGLLNVTGGEFIPDQGVGIFNQSGGTNESQYLYIASGIGSTGSYILSGGGTLTMSQSEDVGLLSGGSFNQTGGSNTTPELILGYLTGAVGTYNLSGAGALLVSGAEYVGYTGSGTFNQSGGSNTIGSGFSMYISYEQGAAGAYNLSGGMASVPANLVVNAGGTLNVSNTGSLTVGGELEVNSTGAVNLNGGSTTVGNVAISGGMVNVNSPLIIDYGGNADPISSIVSYLASGFNGGMWNGAEMISTAVAALDASQSRLVYSLGYADGADGLTSVPSGEIEILPTLAGDAKLQGDVNFGDFQILAQYFGKTGGWDEGNFTYGTTVDFGDFQLLAQDFGASNSAITSSELVSLNNFAAQFGDRLVANSDGVGFRLVSVPEPASVGLMAMTALVFARRKRRRG